jgi:hypothetical protein
MIRVSLRSAVTGVAVLTGVLGGLWVAWSHQQGLANLEACGTVQPGGRRTALIATFGTPRSRLVNPAGTRLVLSFRSPFFAERPIRAVVNVRDDVVMEIDCGDGRIKTYDKY